MQIAKRLSHWLTSTFARLDMFIPTATPVIQAEREGGKPTTENKLTKLNGSALQGILKRKNCLGVTNTTSGATASKEVMLCEFSVNKTLSVQSVRRKFAKIHYASITAMTLAMFAVSFATFATSASAQSNGPASFTQPLHISKGIEASHKQACGNTIDDKIQITPKEMLNSAVFPWARVVSMFSLTGTELMYNSGEEEVIDLLEFHIDSAEKSVREAFEAGVVGDGTADGGRQMVGFGGAIPIVTNTGVYGGINRANVPEWRTSTFDIPAGDVTGITSWDSTTALRVISDLALRRSRNSNYPDLFIFDANSWAAVEAAFVAHQRIVTRSERMERLGLPGYSYNTGAGVVDLVPAAGVGTVMPSDTFFGIDTKSMSIYEFPGHAFVPFHDGQGMRPINQDAIAQGITWSGQLVLENPLFTLRGVTV